MDSSRRTRRTFGTIRKINSGRFQASYVDGDGARHNGPTTYRTKEEAHAWLTRQQTSMLDGVWLNPGGGKTTLGVFGALYWSQQVSNRSSTRKRDLDYWQRYVVRGGLGSVALSELDRSRIQTWIANLLTIGGAHGGPLAPRTVDKARQILGKVLAEAVAQGLIAGSPMAGIKKLKVPKTTHHVLSVGEVGKLADEMPARYRALVPFLCWTGLRIGEAFALTVADVELDADPPYVRVWRAVVDLGRLEISETKTGAGVRSVPLKNDVANRLRAHIDELELTATDPLFPRCDGGMTALNAWRQKVWSPAEYEPVRTPHGSAGRTAATRWLERGVPLHIAKTWMGHEGSSLILDVYAQHEATANLKVIARLNDEDDA